MCRRTGAFRVDIIEHQRRCVAAGPIETFFTVSAHCLRIGLPTGTEPVSETLQIIGKAIGWTEMSRTFR
ncbi:hypothetical protein [Shinella sp.]|uniref:hypothetical protein n=1 Tax=Shinella sp. TaxID=1870904 RepID=UPI00301B7E84